MNHRAQACWIVLASAALSVASWAGLPPVNGRAMRETQVVRVVREVSPAVVYISCQQRVQNPFAGGFWDLFGNDSPFAPPAQEQNSLGSGVLVDPSGYILTNEHVILGGSKIRVTLTTGKEYPARVVGTAPESDLALLKIQGDKPFPVAQLGRSDDLMIGETLIAVGNPYGLSNTVTVGVLSATGRTVEDGKRTYSDFLQTDAAINPGNSGGPLCNILGQVIGINTAIIRNANGIGFAIPIDRARRVMEQLRTYGRVQSLWLGFLPLDPSDSYMRRMHVNYGVVVARTYRFAYPQDEIRQGDLLTGLDGKRLESTGDLNAKLALLSPGQPVRLDGYRDGQPFSATLEAKPMPDRLTPAMAWELLGLRLERGRGGLTVVSVRPNSPADATGLRPGDTVLAVEDQAVPTEEDFLTKARSALGSTGLLISVGRGPWTYYVTLNLIRG